MTDDAASPETQRERDALSRANQDLTRRLADLQRRLDAGGPRAGVGQVLRRARRKLLSLARGGASVPRADWVLETGLFEAAAYKARAGLSGSDRAAAAHYATLGEGRGLRPAADFDPAFYAKSYPELLKSEMGLFVHYARYGRAEGRLGQFVFDEHVRPGARAFDPAKATVAVVCHEASRTGAPILGWNLVRALGATHNVVVVLLQGGELVPRFEADAALVAGPLKRFGDGEALLAALVAALHARHILDFAIVNSVESHAILYPLAQAFVPSVMLIHEFPANVYPTGTMTSALLKATQAVFDAEVQREAALAEWPGLTTRNQHVFHQGASEVPRQSVKPGEARPDPAARHQDLFRRVRGTGDRPVVLGLGTLSMRKGIDLFVSCAQAVAKALGPEGVRFVWIGHVPRPHPEGLYCDWIADQVKRAGLGASVAFLDPVDDLDGAYAAADLVFSPSRLDPFPNVAMDAALAGVPVVCFERANGFAEFLVEDPLTRPLAVPYLDVAAAADLMLRLLADADARLEVGTALRRRARDDFAMARYLDRLAPVIASAKAIAAQERRDTVLLDADPTFRSEVWLDTHETMTRPEAIRFHVRKAASGQEANQYCRRPTPGFVPQTYAEHHPALDAPPFENPLAHWVRAGKPDGPWTHPVLVMDAATPRPGAAGLRSALHIHLHYPELASGILAALAANASTPDLFVTTTSEAKALDLKGRFAGHAGAAVEVRVCPNRGRDIGPMLTMLGDALRGYDVVGHVHGKRSLALTSVGLGTDLGVRWHEFLMQNLLGPRFPMVDVILDRFARDPGLGLVFPDDPNLTGWSLDRDIALGLAARMDPAMTVPRFIDFPIGTMFWARPQALGPLFDARFDWADYPEEPVPIDGTMLHALERLVPVVCRHAGYRYETTEVPGVTR